MPEIGPCPGRFRVILKESGEWNATLPFIGRSETPVSRGRIEPSATKETRSKRFSSLRINCWSSASVDAFFDFGVVLAAVEKTFSTQPWKKIKENPDQFTGVDGAPECRETNLKTGCNLISPDLTGGPGEDLLTRGGWWRSDHFFQNLLP